MTVIRSAGVCVWPALAFFTVLMVACPNPGGDGGTETEAESVRINMASAVPTGVRVAIPGDLAGVIHTGYNREHEAEYLLLKELSSRWVHRDFSWGSVQPEVRQDHERYEDFEWLKNENWDFGWLDEYVKRANDNVKLVMGMLLYDTPWIHRMFPREDHPPGHPLYEAGNPGRRREVREEQIDCFVNYAVETVKRYDGKGPHGKVDAWLIWNEATLQPRFWTWTREDFLELTLRTARAIKPLTDASIVGGVYSVHALSERRWIDGLWENGSHDYLDGIAFHPYGPGHNGTMAFLDRFMGYVRENDEKYGTSLAESVWVNEVGFPTVGVGTGAGWEGIPPQREEERSQAVAKTVALLAAAGTRNVMWYNMFDSGSARDGFGLVWTGGGGDSGDWERKGGYWGFALAAGHLPGMTYVETDFFPSLSAPGRFRAMRFVEENGSRRALLVWNDSPADARDVTVTLGPGTSRRMLWDLSDGTGRSFDEVSTHRLHPVDTSMQTMVFMTWDETL